MDTLFHQQSQWILREKYHGSETAAYKKDIARLKKGEPLDYIIGFKNFLGCTIDLSQKTLIPRNETEFWVGEVLTEVPPLFKSFEKEGIRVLDMFAGSGCIGVATAIHIKNAEVVFADSDKRALEQIKINCKRNHVEKYEILTSDVFSNIKGKYDVIFANPPYISVARKEKVAKSVLKYEPQKALFGGRDGLFYIKKFLIEAKNFMNPDGKVFMEFDSIQKYAIEKILKSSQYKKYQFNKDQYKQWRWVSIHF